MPSPTISYDRTKVLVGQARMFLQKIVTGTVAALPVDSVALNGAWPSAGANIWVPVGATEEGLNFRFSRDTEDINIEEQLTPVDVVTTGLDISFDIVLSQDTLETMAIAYGSGTITVTAPASGVTGKSELKIGSDMDSFAFGFEGVNEVGMARRVFVPEVLSVGTIETMYRRAADARRYATSLRCIAPPEDIKVVNITAVALP